MKRSLPGEIITYFFIILFGYTGIAKLMEIHSFKDQLASSPMLGQLAGLITWALPISEILLAIALFIPVSRLKALYATAILMTLFTAYVITLLFMDNHLSCSCGGIIEELTPKQHVVFNSACVILSVLGIMAFRRRTDTVRFQWLSSGSTVALLGLIGWLVFTAFSTPPAAKTGLEGQRLPSFDLVLQDGKTHLNTADIPAGQPFIVISFSPWCQHCQAETRDIIQHMQQLKNTRIYYITPYPFEDMLLFYRHYKMAQYPNVTMGWDYKDFYLSYFKTRMVPLTAVFDAKKRLQQAFLLPADAATLAKITTE